MAQRESAATAADPPWIFAYGSLMWRPDFAFAERVRARVAGYHRSLCIFSHHHRGTPGEPGLVLGLDRGGSCVGIAFRVAPEAWADTLAALRQREQVTGVYREVATRVTLADGRSVAALAYVADRAHAQYTGKLDRTAMLERVRRGVGLSGPNVDYVRNTWAHLAELGIADPDLAWISGAVGAPQP